MKVERCEDRHVIGTHRFGIGSVMVWGCFWAGGLGPLITLKGNIGQNRYIDCLAGHFLPWYEEVSKEEKGEFLFQEDGAPWYKKERCLVDNFDFWPTQSPDLNPIENLWTNIEHKISISDNAKQLENFIYE